MSDWTYKDTVLIYDTTESKPAIASLAQMAGALNQYVNARITALGLLPDLEAEELAVAAAVAGSSGLPLNTKVIEAPQGEMLTLLHDTRSELAQQLQLDDSLVGWDTISSARSELATKMARMTATADIVLIAAGSSETTCDMREIASTLVFDSGRPVIVIPDDYRVEGLPARIAVGWDGSKSSARALHDAVPLLGCVDQVMLLNAEPEDASDLTALSKLSRAQSHLESHGISSTSHIVDIDNEETAGEALAKRLLQMDCDLCVLGANPTSWIEQMFFKSTTDTLLDNLPRPLLLAH